MNDNGFCSIARSLRDKVAFLKHQCGMKSGPEAAVLACPDENELASRLAERTLDMTLHERLAEQLVAAESALKRLSAGAYGICGECGEEIGIARLTASPTSTLCIHCQEEMEAAPSAPYQGLYA